MAERISPLFALSFTIVAFVEHRAMSDEMLTDIRMYSCR